MSKSGVAGTGWGISGRLRRMARLPDGIAGLRRDFGRFGTAPQRRPTVLEPFRVLASRAGSSRYGASLMVAGLEMGGAVQAGSGRIEGPRARSVDNDSCVVFGLRRRAQQQVDLTGGKPRRPRGPDSVLPDASGNPEEAGFRLIECRRNEELEEEAGKSRANDMRDGSHGTFRLRIRARSGRGPAFLLPTKPALAGPRAGRMARVGGSSSAVGNRSACSA